MENSNTDQNDEKCHRPFWPGTLSTSLLQRLLTFQHLTLAIPRYIISIQHKCFNLFFSKCTCDEGLLLQLGSSRYVIHPSWFFLSLGGYFKSGPSESKGGDFAKVRSCYRVTVPSNQARYFLLDGKTITKLPGLLSLSNKKKAEFSGFKA